MSLELRFWLIIGTFIYMGIIYFFLKRKKMTLKYSLLWLFSAVFLLLLAAFPQIAVLFAHLIGVSTASNAVYLLLLFYILLLLISLTAIVSKQHRQIKSLVQQLALLEKKVLTLEENN